MFSPPQPNSFEYLFFNINSLGIKIGIINSLKRNSMILISFCWLATIHSLYDFFEAVKFIKPLNRVTIIFLKWIQNIRLEFTLFYYSLNLRIIKKEKSVRRKILSLKLISLAAMNRIFINIGKMTYTGESHKINNSHDDKPLDISLINVSASYEEDKSVLHNITLSITQKDFLFIGGSDCSGKTTLLRVISGYIPKIEGYITKGDVLMSGIPMKEFELDEVAAEIKFFTNYSDDLFFGLTVGQEIMSYTEDFTLAQKILEELKLFQFWDSETILLSGGEKIKLLFACATISNAKVLLFDSPLSQIDPISRMTFINLLKELNEKGKTIVIADNQYTFYKNLASKFLILDQGKIKEELITKQFESQTLIEKTEPIKIEIKNPLTNGKFKNSSIIELKNATLKLGEKLILYSINLKILSHECIIVLGPNGSGKTSLMFLLSGIYNSTNKDSEISRKCNVGMVFQNSDCQILEVTVEKEIAIGPILNNWSNPDRETFIINSKPWINANLKTETIDLHQSQIKMLAAVSTNVNAKLMIFDEPTLDIDNKNINKMIVYFRHLINSGISIIIVTHDLRITDLATRYLLINNGKILEDTLSKGRALECLEEIKLLNENI